MLTALAAVNLRVGATHPVPVCFNLNTISGSDRSQPIPTQLLHDWTWTILFLYWKVTLASGFTGAYLIIFCYVEYNNMCKISNYGYDLKTNFQACKGTNNLYTPILPHFLRDLQKLRVGYTW